MRDAVPALATSRRLVRGSASLSPRVVCFTAAESPTLQRCTPLLRRSHRGIPVNPAGASPAAVTCDVNNVCPIIILPVEDGVAHRWVLGSDVEQI